MKRILACLAALLALGTAAAEDKAVNGLPIKLGDSIEAVKQALGTTRDPEDVKTVTRNSKQLRLKTKGIWVFFDQDGRAYTIRLDAPFAGNIGGAAIGQSRGALVEKLGKPAKVIKSRVPGIGLQEPYIYYIDDATTARFDFDSDGEIETIYLLK